MRFLRCLLVFLDTQSWCEMDNSSESYIYVYGRKKYLNRTLEIDSPFQTFAVGLLVEFID